MCSTPPSNAVCRKTSMRCPHITFVFIKFKKSPDIFRKSNSLKYSHVLSAGDYISTSDISVYVHDKIHNKVFFGFKSMCIAVFPALAIFSILIRIPLWLQKISVYQRRIYDSGYLYGGNFLT